MANEQKGNFVSLYSSRAHVFQINPETKTSWLPKGEQAIPISFVASIVNEDSQIDSSKRELKIIGTNDNGDTVLDASILSKTTFTKRSQKFGQWIDHTGTVYGLGFNSETELDEFVETFQQLQRDILPPLTHHHTMVSGSLQPQMASQSDRIGWNQQHLNNVSETNGRYQAGKTSTNPMQQQYSNTLAHPGHQQQQIKRQQLAQSINHSNGNASLINGNNDSINSNNGAGYPRSQSMFGLQTRTNNSNNSAMMSGRVTPETENSPVSQTEWQLREQLKYENERLKQALDESSKNAGVWHNELLNLRTNNVKLTQALQESKAHVEEWERELLSLRDENKEMKLRVLALESANDPEKGNEYRKDLQKYKNYVDEIQSELRRKENEVEELQKSMEELGLKTQALVKNEQLDDSASSQFAMNSNLKQKFYVISAKLEAKISELANVQKEFAQVIDKLYH